MKKIFYLILLCAIGSQATYAQSAIKQIRDHYAEVKQRIANMDMEGMQPPPEYYKLKVSQNLPATGGHFVDVMMYYGFNDDDEIYPSHYFEFATVSYNFAARKYYEEYLFDRKGDITFIYARMPDMDDGNYYEHRYYFSGGKVIEMKVSSRKIDNENAPFDTVYSGKTVPQAYSGNYEQYFKYASRLKHLFQSIEDINIQ